MNTQQIEKHGEVIKFFIDNPDKGVLRKIYEGTINEKWIVDYDPLFNISCVYVQNDEYAELRKLVIDTPSTQIQISYNCGEAWYDKSIRKAFSMENQMLRVKPDEPKFKVGDWVIYDNQPEYELGQWSAKSIQSEYHRLWQPQEDDWCVFWDGYNKSYRVARFNKVATGKPRVGKYKDAQGNYFNNIAPLEYAMTLKDG